MMAMTYTAKEASSSNVKSAYDCEMVQLLRSAVRTVVEPSELMLCTGICTNLKKFHVMNSSRMDMMLAAKV